MGESQTTEVGLSMRLAPPFLSLGNSWVNRNLLISLAMHVLALALAWPWHAFTAHACPRHAIPAHA